MSGLCIMIAGIALLGCGDAITYTLYRNPDPRRKTARRDFRFSRWRGIQQRELSTSPRPVSAAARRQDEVLVREREISPVTEHASRKARGVKGVRNDR
jgi:hypothetical protein